MNFDHEINRLIDRAIEEDIGTGDITTTACVPKEVITSGRMVLKQSGVIAGLPYIEKIFQKVDPEIKVQLLVEEGTRAKAGTIIARVSGPARGILSAERLVLNLLQHASGVATITAEFKKKVAGTKCEILDTRKTLPGLRCLEKYAVIVGGGVVHRWGLDDRFIIKTNHLAFLAGNSEKPIIDAVKSVRKMKPDAQIEVEINDEAKLQEALDADPDSIMLDHMYPDRVARCVKKAAPSGKKLYLESMGAITIETVRQYAETGVDGIAISALTYSVQALDIRMHLMS